MPAAHGETEHPRRSYEWSVFGEMTRDGELTYQHDGNGNRQEVGYPGGVSAHYTFDFADREATLEVAVPGEPVQPVVTGYSFDLAGNQTQVATGADVVQMSYDDASQLASIERPAAGVHSEMLYDGRGFLRHAEEIRPALIFEDGFETGDSACWSSVVGGVGGGTCPGSPMVAPVYSSEGVLQYQLKEGGLERYVLYLAGRPVLLLALPAAEQVEQGYLAADHLGTPILASDPFGLASWAGGFEPFGTDFSGATEAGMYLRFPGQWGDNAWADVQFTGLLYNVSRWYQRSVGKYDRVDPMGARGDSNPYIYAQGNPVVYFDLLGEKSRTCCAPIAGGLLASFKHCFIHVQDDETGEDTTYSLHGMGNRRRAWGGPLGCTFKNDGFDKGAIRENGTECGSWAADCGSDECVRKNFESYPRATSYSLRGPNSNTFAGTVTRACGLEAPPIAGGWHTPGWNDAPAPVANGKTCPDRR